MVSKNDNFRSEIEDSNGEYPESWVPKPGDMLVGKVVRYSTGITSYGEQIIVVIEDEESGELQSVWLLHTVLYSEFKKRKPEPGERVGIKRLQDSEKGYARYLVRVDRQEKLPDFASYEPPGGNSTSQPPEQIDPLTSIKSDKIKISDDDIPF